MKKALTLLVSFMVGSVAMSADYNSDTLKSVDQSNDGRVLVKYFSYATGTTAVASNSTVTLTILPPNARVIDGALAISAMGGGQLLDLGLRAANGGSYIKGTTANDPDLFLDGISLSNAVTDTFANLVQGDSNADYELGGNFVELYATNPDVAWTTNETITGWVKYIDP